MEGAILVAAADPDPARLSKAARFYPLLKTFSGHHDLLAVVVAVVFAVPTSMQFAVAKYAILSGMDVLFEMPLCTSCAEGGELLRLARESNAILSWSGTSSSSFNPAIVLIRELVASGEIGQLRYITATRTNLGPVRADVNAVWDLASHDVAIFQWLIGQDVEDVTAVGASYLQPGVEDIALVTLRYPGNVLATIQCSWLDPKKVRRMTIVGSRRMITWDDLDLSHPLAVYEKGGDSRWETSDYGDFLRRIPLGRRCAPPESAARGALEKSGRRLPREAVRTGCAPRSDGAFGVDVVRVLEQIDARLRAGRTRAA